MVQNKYFLVLCTICHVTDAMNRFYNIHSQFGRLVSYKLLFLDFWPFGPSKYRKNMNKFQSFIRSLDLVHCVLLLIIDEVSGLVQTEYSVALQFHLSLTFFFFTLVILLFQAIFTLYRHKKLAQYEQQLHRIGASRSPPSPQKSFKRGGSAPMSNPLPFLYDGVTCEPLTSYSGQSNSRGGRGAKG